VSRACATLALLGLQGCGCSQEPPRSPRPLAPELRAVLRAGDEGRLDLARRLAQQYAETHPGDGHGAYALGLAHAWNDNHGAARPWLERALALEPEMYPAHEALAKSLFLLGELAGARREYEAFLAVVPDEPRGHYGLGLIELEETRLEEAARRFARAIALFEALPAAQREARLSELAECHARLGEVHFARGEHAAARAELVRATGLCPTNISAFFTLSLVERRLGNERAADEAARRYEAARQALLAQQRAGKR
jgi:tetratricopeptide (TPR) repeat protein